MVIPHQDTLLLCQLFPCHRPKIQLPFHLLYAFKFLIFRQGGQIALIRLDPFCNIRLFLFGSEFYDKGGRCLMRLPPVERREAPIDSLQPSQFSVDREKCAAVGEFLHGPADLVIPVLELDGALVVLDGHTRLYTAWQRGIRTAMVFSSAQEQELRETIGGFVQEARRRGIFHVSDMALLSPQEQEEQWHSWCDAYFAAQAEQE